jgi:hypothetical protein
MKCLVCQTDNKDGVKNCRKCGVDMELAPIWKPSWAWHAKVLGIVYSVLAVAYFVLTAFLNRLPAPYRLRDIPHEVTPWLQK